MYIKDFTEILENARCCKKIVNRIYISNDTPISLIKLVHLIQRYLNLPLTRLHIPIPVGKAVGFVGSFVSNIFGVPVPLTKNRIAAMTRDICYSAQKLKKDMEYQLPYGMEVGLSNTIKWYQQQNLI
jgi:nucleoside-diphosphate-sugar epimerase